MSREILRAKNLSYWWNHPERWGTLPLSTKYMVGFDPDGKNPNNTALGMTVMDVLGLWSPICSKYSIGYEWLERDENLSS